jgi:hypothetical protein
MKKLAHAMVITSAIFGTSHSALSLPPQPERTVAECSQPVMLELSPGKNGGMDYQIAGKTYHGYPLDDLRELLSGCKTPRPLYALIDYRVPAGQISSAVAPKLQVDNVRYFIRYPEQNHLIIEIKIVGSDSKLP